MTSMMPNFNTVVIHVIIVLPIHNLLGVFGHLFVVNTLKIHLILIARLNSYSKDIGEGLVLKPLQSSFFRVDNLTLIRCSSVGSWWGSDSGINLGLKFRGPRSSRTQEKRR
jgi:hypothetical protein